VLKHRLISLILIIAAFAIGYLYLADARPWESGSARGSFGSQTFKLGLDLNGGTELVYRADVSKVATGSVGDAMSSLRDVIERRVNIFGVSEPIVQVENPGIISGQSDERLIVDLPGVTNVGEAIKMIGETPQLEFRLLNPAAKGMTQAELASSTIDQIFAYTGLTGRYLESAQLEFSNSGGSQIAGSPEVLITFNSEGKDLMSKITSEHKGEVLAIILDGQVISSPTIQDTITDGKALITGRFTADEAKSLVRNLNYGALPVPISLISTESVGPSLGVSAGKAGVVAGLAGFGLVVLFLIIWYRLPGILASVALLIYIVLSLAVFKLIPVTLTAAGIAGFILSIGMAVDANILIFERTKEELKKGKNVSDALHEGFTRAWLSIRDSNISSIITAIILFWLGTSAVKGFALTLGLGVLISMFTAISVSRTFLFAVAPKKEHGPFIKFLFSNGLHTGK
jgi:protein-export membrane protein SecD